MAFLGVLPRQDFGTRLGQGIGQGLGAGVSQASQLVQQMALEKEKNRPIAELLASTQKGKEGENSGEFNLLSPQQKAVLAFQDPKSFAAYQSLEEGYLKDKEKSQLTSNLSETLNNMAATLEKGNLGITPSKYVTAEGRRDSGYFDRLALQLESIGKEMVSKGVLSQARFNFLIENLPSSDKTDATNAGVIEAWADDLKIPRPEGLEKFYKSNELGIGEKKSRSPGKDHVWVKAKDGNEYRIPKSDLNAALQSGGVVVR